jgi:hypothetical protein
MSEPEAQEALRVLIEEFATVGHVGPRRAAAFLHDGPNEEAQADAWGAVRDLLAGLT